MTISFKLYIDFGIIPIFVTTHLNASSDDFILLLNKKFFDDCLHVGLVQFVFIPSKPLHFSFIETTNVDFVD